MDWNSAGLPNMTMDLPFFCFSFLMYSGISLCMIAVLLSGASMVVEAITFRVELYHVK
ncbi:hypothetical protein [Elizabethkingia anophelis]|uniref:hypothetical protein n=1 Tax=Elizabethkingia anophelis TaxID=1117645 RepID=UPI0035DE69B1